MKRTYQFNGTAHCIISGAPITRDVEALSFAARDISGYSKNAPETSRVFVTRAAFDAVVADAPAAPVDSPVYGGRTFALEVHIKKCAGHDVMRVEFLRNSNKNQWARLNDDSDGCEVYAVNLNNLRAHGILDVINRHVTEGYILGDAFVDGEYIGTAVAEWATRDERGRYLKKSERDGKIPFLVEVDGITSGDNPEGYDKGWDNHER